MTSVQHVSKVRSTKVVKDKRRWTQRITEILQQRRHLSVEASAGASPMISGEGTQLKWEPGTYRHHQSRLLGLLYVRSGSSEDIANFAIDWEIQEKNSSGSAFQRQFQQFGDT